MKEESFKENWPIKTGRVICNKILANKIILKEK